MAETYIRNCSSCRHMIFDELWGEYKCLVYQHRIYDVKEIEECDDWLRRQASKDEKKSINYQDSRKNRKYKTN